MALLVVLSVGVLGYVRYRYGGGETFPDRTSDPEHGFDELEVVATTDYPPGNVAVAPDGRVFVTLHPDGRPSTKVALIEDGQLVPWPNEEMQRPAPEGIWFHTPLSLRIDRQNRLWVLDFAEHGTGQPKLLAFDLDSRELVHRFDVPREFAGAGSHLNDFQVHPDGDRIYIADASVFAQTPALLVYDIELRRMRRLLDSDVSVRAENFVITVEGQPQVVFGLFAVRPGVDSIALDRRGEWLYFAAMTASRFYRVRTRDLDDTTMSRDELSARVEALEPKTVSDGIAIDDEDRLYVSDPEHSAIVTREPDGTLRTLFRDPRLRWPDGFGFGPDGWLYVTCSALQHVLMKNPAEIAVHRPFHVYRFRSGATATPGH